MSRTVRSDPPRYKLVHSAKKLWGHTAIKGVSVVKVDGGDHSVSK